MVLWNTFPLFAATPLRHIQVNLSKEYFASLLGPEDSASSAADEGKEVSPKNEKSTINVLSGANERLDDIELGVTPFGHDSPPIKGIIKNSSEVVLMCHISHRKIFNFMLVTRSSCYICLFQFYQTSAIAYISILN